MHESDFLLFTDSDLEFHPQCLKQMVRLALHRRNDITSTLPAIRYETLGELLGLLAAMVIINARLSLYQCNNPRIPRAIVAGGFMLVKRDVYHPLGGHAAVRGQVVEDVAFGTRAKALGKRVLTAITHDLYTARMYEGWGDAFRGLKKNAFAGANYRLGLGVVTVLFLFLFGAMVPMYLVMGAWWWWRLPSAWTGAAAMLGALGLAAQVAVGVNTSRYVGWRKRVVWWLPASFLFYLAVFVGSVVDHYRGGNTWAGRRVGKVQSIAEAAVVEETAAGKSPESAVSR
jgi:hypothetical protein